MYFLSVIYDDSDISTYNGISIHNNDKKQTIFTNTNPTVDYLVALFICRPDINKVSASSSLDHFIMDGGVLNDESPSNEDVVMATKIYNERYKNL